MKAAWYFRNIVQPKRPYVTDEMWRIVYTTCRLPRGAFFVTGHA